MEIEPLDASSVLANEALMAELLEEFQQLKSDGPADYDFDSWIQRRLRALTGQLGQGPCGSARRDVPTQLAFSSAPPRRASLEHSRPYQVHSYSDRGGRGPVDDQGIDALPSNQLQFLHPRPASSTPLHDYKPKFFERPRPKLVAANKENQGGWIALDGEGDGAVDEYNAVPGKLGLLEGNESHVHRTRRLRQQQQRRPPDYEEDELWMGARPSSYAAPNKHDPDRLVPRDSKGKPLRQARLQPWASVAELQRSLQRSEQVAPKLAVGQKERRMAAASALAKQAVVMGVDPSRLVARPKGPRPAPAGQQDLSACSAKAGEESTVSENIAIARNAEAKGYVGVIVNDFEEKARREKEEAEAAWRQSEAAPGSSSTARQSGTDGADGVAMESAVMDGVDENSDTDSPTLDGGLGTAEVADETTFVPRAEERQPSHVNDLARNASSTQQHEGSETAPNRPATARGTSSTAKSAAQAFKRSGVDGAVAAMLSALGDARCETSGPDALVDLMLSLAKQQALSELGAPVSEVKSREASPRRSRLKVNWPASWSDTSASEDNTSLNADTSRELPGPHTRQGALRRPAAAQPRSIPSKRSAVPQQPGGWNDTTSVEQPRIRRQASELDAPLPRGPPQKGRGRGGRQNRRPLATEVRAGAGKSRGPPPLAGEDRALERELAAAIAADLEHSRGSGATSPNSSLDGGRHWAAMEAMEGRLAKLLHTIDARLSNIDQHQSHSPQRVASPPRQQASYPSDAGSPPTSALGMEELARCLQVLETLEASESEIRERWLSSIEDPIRWQPQGIRPPSRPLSASASQAINGQSPSHPAGRRLMLGSSPCAKRGGAGVVNTKLLLVDPPPVELLPDIVVARIHKGRKAFLRRQRQLQGDLVAQAEPDFSVVQVVQSVADMLIDEILVEAATEVTDVFDSFAEELFEQEFQG